MLLHPKSLGVKASDQPDVSFVKMLMKISGLIVFCIIRFILYYLYNILATYAAKFVKIDIFVFLLTF